MAAKLLYRLPKIAHNQFMTLIFWAYLRMPIMIPGCKPQNLSGMIEEVPLVVILELRISVPANQPTSC